MKRNILIFCIICMALATSGCGVHSSETATVIKADREKSVTSVTDTETIKKDTDIETSKSHTSDKEQVTTAVSNSNPDTDVSQLHKVIYLTFDDGPSQYTEGLLKILDKYNVKATFFTVGSKYENLIKKEYEAGHTVAIHTDTHDYSKIYQSPDSYFEDLYKQRETIKRIIGIESNLIRFPGGSSNSTSKQYCPGIMTVLTNEVTERGFYYFDWNVSSGDGSPTPIGTDKIFSNVTEGIKKHDISVVLQHDSQKYSIDAVESIIKWGLENGYTFLPLNENSFDAHHTVTN